MKKPNLTQEKSQKRLKIAFFDYPDVFEDFYPHYGVDQKSFATSWHNTGTHTWLKIIHEEIGEATWYALSIKPQITEDINEYTHVRVKFLRSSWLHRVSWKLFYNSRMSWRLKRYYKTYAAIGSYTALFSWRIFNKIRKDKPDIILAQDYCSGRFDVLYLFSWILKIPLITYHTGSTPESYSGKFLKKFTIRRSKWIFSSGIAEQQRLQESYKIPASRLNIIRPPVDMLIYKPVDKYTACRSVSLIPEKRYWLFIGRLDDQIKRISSIIKSFCAIAAHFENIDLLIIGTGNDEEKLKMQASENIKGRIHFIGWIKEDRQKAIYYNCAEWLLMASTREGFPTVIGEAFACGIPAICSDVGTISDLVVPGKTGWLFPPGDDEKMQQLFQMVAWDMNTLSATKPEIRQLAEEHVSFTAVAKALKEGFNSLKIIE